MKTLESTSPCPGSPLRVFPEHSNGSQGPSFLFLSEQSLFKPNPERRLITQIPGTWPHKLLQGQASHVAKTCQQFSKECRNQSKYNIVLQLTGYLILTSKPCCLMISQWQSIEKPTSQYVHCSTSTSSPFNKRSQSAILSARRKGRSDEKPLRSSHCYVSLWVFAVGARGVFEAQRLPRFESNV